MDGILNNRRIAKFHKISFEQYLSDKITPDVKLTEDDIKNLQKEYDNIVLPKRSTFGSAGYDFVTPIPIILGSGCSITIPTGIRCEIDDGWVLKLYPRSSLGFKFQMTLSNSVGIIDSDYAHAKNEGHIMVKIRNMGDGIMSVKRGDRFIQGIFIPYGITIDDVAEGERMGGLGSTGK